MNFRNATKIFLFLLVFIAIPTLAPQVCPAEEMPSVKTIVVTGTGKILRDDTASARETAISESLVSAVGLVIVELMPLDLMVKNFQPLNEVMYTQTEKFIHGYRVLAETKHEDRYRVMVEARISVSRIRDHLATIGFLVGRKELPKILFMIAEQEIGTAEPVYWWGGESPLSQATAENAMSDAMAKKGFGFISYAGSPMLEKEPGLLGPEIDNQTAIEFGMHYGADVVVIGLAFAEQTTNVMGEDTRSFKGTISARGIRVETGEEIAATYQSKISVGTDELQGGREALTAAGASAGEDLALQIIAAMKKRENQSASIKIAVQGTNFLSNYVAFRRALNSIQGVKSIRASEMKSNAAVVLVDYQKSTRELAEELMLKPFKKFGINISEITEDFLNIELVPKNRPPVPAKSEPLADSNQ